MRKFSADVLAGGGRPARQAHHLNLVAVADHLIVEHMNVLRDHGGDLARGLLQLEDPAPRGLRGKLRVGRAVAAVGDDHQLLKGRAALALLGGGRAAHRHPPAELHDGAVGALAHARLGGLVVALVREHAARQRLCAPSRPPEHRHAHTQKPKAEHKVRREAKQRRVDAQPQRAEHASEAVDREQRHRDDADDAKAKLPAADVVDALIDGAREPPRRQGVHRNQRQITGGARVTQLADVRALGADPGRSSGGAAESTPGPAVGLLLPPRG